MTRFVALDSIAAFGRETQPVFAEPTGSEWCAFVLSDELRESLERAPDDPGSYLSSEAAWVGQTFVKLKRWGYPVNACRSADAGEFPLVVAHPKHLDGIHKHLRRQRSSTRVIATASDKVGHRFKAHFLIVQNLRQISARRLYVPHWPQPGLVARERVDPHVGAATFKGVPGALHPELHSEWWASSLADLGIAWNPVLRADVVSNEWADYSRDDVVVALRPPTKKLAAKPATKLINAWLAGTPAILGPEPAYREMRCSHLDYIEVASPGECLNALRALAREPDRYQAMVTHGRQRAHAFNDNSMIGYWVTALSIAGRTRMRGMPRRSLALTKR